MDDWATYVDEERQTKDLQRRRHGRATLRPNPHPRYDRQYSSRMQTRVQGHRRTSRYSSDRRVKPRQATCGYDMTARRTSGETYLAFLRGINVGGKNIIKMAELRSCFEAEVFRDAATYIQSGNVIFSTPSSALSTLTISIEEMLAAAFYYEARVALRSRKQMP